MLPVLSFGQIYTMPQILALPFDSGAYEIIYNDDTYNGVSPRNISFRDGVMLFIPQLENGLLLDVHGKKIAGMVNFPQPDLKGRYSRAFNFTFSSDSMLSHKSRPTFSEMDEMGNIHKNTEYSSFSMNTYADSQYIDSIFLFYSAEGNVLGITESGVLMANQDVVTWLVERHSKTWYANSIEKEKHAKLIRTGKYLIVDGIFYPSVASQANDYFAEMDYKWEINKEYDSYRTGSNGFEVALNGDLYFSYGKGLSVYNQNGKEMAVIDINSNNRIVKALASGTFKGGIGGYYTTIHTNGDVYAMQAVKNDKVYFYNTSRKWGPDYVGWAKLGCSITLVAEQTKRIQDLNNREIWILRNALFALQGYDFKNWDLSCYFNGFDWYKPNPNVKADVTLLTEDQKRLFDLVLEEEARRKSPN